MHKSEIEFLRELEIKAKEERKLLATEILPVWAKGLGEWLVVNPWRVLVPIAGLSYMALRLVGGAPWREFVLGLFGGFR